MGNEHERVMEIADEAETKEIVKDTKEVAITTITILSVLVMIWCLFKIIYNRVKGRTGRGTFDTDGQPISSTSASEAEVRQL